MSWLLDTNVVSELRRRHPDAAVAEWIARKDPLTFYLSAVSVFELELGILRKERTDAAQGRVLRQWLEDSVLPAFHGRILPIDTGVAQTAARLHVPDPLPERDALIAATALAAGLTVVTRNVRDFAGVGVVNPWVDAPS